MATPALLQPGICLRALGAALSLAACGPAPPHRPPPPTSAVTIAAPPAPAPSASAGALGNTLRVLDARGLEVIAKIPAYDARAAGGRVVAVDPGVRGLRGLDLAGNELWKTPLEVEPSGPVRLYPSFGAAGRLLVHVSNQLIVVDPRTGVIARQSQGPWQQDKTWLSVGRGACSVGDACNLRLIDCEDAHPYGPPFHSAVTHLYAKIGQPHDNVCWGPRLLVGRGGDVVVVVTDGLAWEEPNSTKKPGPVTVGIDTKTGATAWSTRAVGCDRCASSGVSRDGSTCWLADDGGKLEVFSCATGKLVFRKQLPEKAIADTRPSLYTAWVEPGGLFLSTATEASLLDPRTGAPLWSTPLPPGGLGLPLATRLEFDAFSTWGERTVLLLDPRSGKEAARLALPGYTEVFQADDLGLRVRGGPAFDARGTRRPFAEEPPLFAVSRDQAPRLLRTGDGARVLAEVTTDLAIVAERRTAQGDELALYVWGPPGSTGELVFARRRPPPLGQPAGRPGQRGRPRPAACAGGSPRFRRCGPTGPLPLPTAREAGSPDFPMLPRLPGAAPILGPRPPMQDRLNRLPATEAPGPRTPPERTPLSKFHRATTPGRRPEAAPGFCEHE